MTHTETFLAETQEIAKLIDSAQIEKMVAELKALRERGGRLFLVGLGGSAANCSHAVNDFRRLCGIDASTPVDNIAEFSAAMNDQGRNVVFRGIIRHAKKDDILMVLSVGGGEDHIDGVSEAIPDIIDWFPGKTLGLVGRDGGYTGKKGLCVVIPTVSPERVTPHTEGWQLVILHCLVSHPDLQLHATKW